MRAQLASASVPRGPGDRARDAAQGRTEQPASRVYRYVCTCKHTTELIYKDRYLPVIILGEFGAKSFKSVGVYLCSPSVSHRQKSHINSKFILWSKYINCLRTNLHPSRTAHVTLLPTCHEGFELTIPHLQEGPELPLHNSRPGLARVPSSPSQVLLAKL